LDDDYIFGALSAGASGFLKRTKPEELISAIHTVADGDCCLAVRDTAGDRPHGDNTACRGAIRRQAREAHAAQRGVELIGRGLSNREIAESS
jgi:DNA-binding NarL/FixJ family response regulator